MVDTGAVLRGIAALYHSPGLSFLRASVWSWIVFAPRKTPGLSWRALFRLTLDGADSGGYDPGAFSAAGEGKAGDAGNPADRAALPGIGRGSETVCQRPGGYNGNCGTPVPLVYGCGGTAGDAWCSRWCSAVRLLFVFASPLAAGLLVFGEISEKENRKKGRMRDCLPFSIAEDGIMWYNHITARE